MAKITATYDTKEKTLVVEEDGKAVANVREAYFTERYDEKGFSCVVTTFEKDDDQGIGRMTRLMASELGLEPGDSLVDDVSRYFSR